MFKRVYWLFSFLGLTTVWASFILGFRYQPDALGATGTAASYRHLPFLLAFGYARRIILPSF
jgi:hypothetical protein